MSPSSRRMLPGAAVAGFQIAFLACAHVPPASGAETVAVTQEVQIVVDGAKISASPRIAVVKPGGKLSLLASGLKEGTIEIDFNVEGRHKGPFKPGKGPRGRFVLSPSEPGAAAEVDAANDTSWKYEVVLRSAAGQDLDAIDPMVIIKQ